MKNNVMIIEYNWFHDEVVIPLIELLEDDFNLFLIMNKKSLNKGIWQLYSQNKPFNQVFYVKKNFKKYISSINRWKRIFLTINAILKNKIDTIILNTLDIYNEDILLLIKIIKKLKLNIKMIGIIHNGELVSKYFRLVDEIFVLNKYITKSVPYKTNYIYPVLYKYKNNLVSVKNNTFSIVIPGNIEYSRRDYKFLLKVIKKEKNFLKQNNIKFIILGNYKNSVDGEDFFNLVKQNGDIDLFKFYNYTIPYEEYMKVIINSQLIMPLIHPTVKNFKNYFTNKISASFNMSFSTNIPLVMYKDFQNVGNFNKFSFFYDFSISSFKKVIYSIIDNKQLLLSYSLNIKNESSFSKENQRKKLYNILKKEEINEKQ